VVADHGGAEVVAEHEIGHRRVLNDFAGPTAVGGVISEDAAQPDKTDFAGTESLDHFASHREALAETLAQHVLGERHAVVFPSLQHRQHSVVDGRFSHANSPFL